MSSPQNRFSTRHKDGLYVFEPVENIVTMNDIDALSLIKSELCDVVTDLTEATKFRWLKVRGANAPPPDTRTNRRYGVFDIYCSTELEHAIVLVTIAYNIPKDKLPPGKAKISMFEMLRDAANFANLENNKAWSVTTVIRCNIENQDFRNALSGIAAADGTVDTQDTTTIQELMKTTFARPVKDAWADKSVSRIFTNEISMGSRTFNSSLWAVIELE